MDKLNLKTIKLEKELQSMKDEAEALRAKRRELMFRLRIDAGFTYQRIANIYGCKPQYVEQEVSAYKAQDAPQAV